MNQMLGVGAALTMVGNTTPAVAAEIQDPLAPNRAQQAHTVGEQAGPLAVAASMPESGLTANTASTSPEGRNGNDIVCGGVDSKADAIRLAKGGLDDCGKRVDKIWSAMGITLPVIQGMRVSLICDDEGYKSSGLKHGPVPSHDKPLMINGKRAAWVRPLSDWGPGCYEGLEGEREDGTNVGLMFGCGNPVTEKVPPAKQPEKPKQPKQPTASLDVQKGAKDYHDNPMNVTDKIFTIAATCIGKGNKVIQNSVKIGTERVNLLKGCLPSKARGRLRYAVVTEFNVPESYEIESPKSGTQRVYLPRLLKKVHGKGFKQLAVRVAKFTNKQKAPLPTLPPKVCEPPATGTYPACELPKGAEPVTPVTPATPVTPVVPKEPETPKGAEPGTGPAATDPNANLPACNEHTVGIACKPA